MMKTNDLKQNVPISSSPVTTAEHRESDLHKQMVQDIFKAIAEKRFVEITPRLSGNGDIIYPQLSHLAGVEGSHPTEILEELCQQRILTKEPANLSFECPTCRKEITVQSLVCPNCGGTELMSGTVAQHLRCLHFDFESNFDQSAGETRCPKCSKKVSAQDSDYVKLGIFFKCVSCGEFTTRAKRLYSCPECQQVFETTKEPPIEAYKYVVNHDIDLMDLNSFDPSSLIRELENVGLEARINASVRSKRGGEHSFTLLVKNSANAIESRGKVADSLVAVDVIVENPQVGPSGVYALFAKAIDCEISHRVLVAIPGVSEKTKALAHGYNILVIESRNTVLAAVPLRDCLRGILEKGNVAPGKILRVGKRNTRRRSSIDIMSDILSIVSLPSSQSEIIGCANLSFEQCRKYLAILERMGLLGRYLEDAVRLRFVITERGREYLAGLSGEFGRIAEGDRSIWGAKRRTENSFLEGNELSKTRKLELESTAKPDSAKAFA